MTAKKGNSNKLYPIQHMHLEDGNWNRIQFEHEHGEEVVFLHYGFMMKDTLRWLKRQFDAWVVENNPEGGACEVLDALKRFSQDTPMTLIRAMHEQFGASMPDSLGALIDEHEEVKMRFYAELLSDNINALVEYYRKRAHLDNLFEDDAYDVEASDSKAETPSGKLLN